MVVCWITSSERSYKVIEGYKAALETLYGSAEMPDFDCSFYFIIQYVYWSKRLIRLEVGASLDHKFKIYPMSDNEYENPNIYEILNELKDDFWTFFSESFDYL